MVQFEDKIHNSEIGSFPEIPLGHGRWCKEEELIKTHKFIKMNDVEIDEGISTLIQTLWDNGIETIQCCQGGDEAEKETRFTHIENGKIIENAHIIFFKIDLDKIKEFLPENTDYIIGDKSKIGYIEEWLGSFDGVWANFKLK